MEAAAVDVDDEILGKVIRLFVAEFPGTKIGRDEIEKLFKDNLPSYAAPSKIVFVNSLPRNSYGKVDKERLRQI